MLLQVREQVELANRELALGRLPGAAAALEEAIRLWPADVALRQRLAGLYLRMGHRAHAAVQLEHVAGRYAAEGELLKAMAVVRLIGVIQPGNLQALQALTELYARQAEGSATALLPAGMSGAVAAQEPAPDLDLHALELIRAGGLPPPASDEEVPPPAPGETEIDLGPLPSSPLFSALDRDAFAALVRLVELRWMHAGELLVAEGERGESMFIVVQGEVDVLRGDQTVAVIGEGSFFGEMALVTDSPRLATVVASGDGLLFELHRARLSELVATRPEVGRVVDAFHRDRLLANVLRASPVFRPLSAQEKEQIAARFVRRRLAPREVILRQGETGRGFCVLLRGKCDAFHESGPGEEVPLRQLREGDIFGEISLLLDRPCTATVRAAGLCEVLELPRADFRALVLPNQQVRAMIEAIATERLARTADLIEREPRLMRDYIV